MNIKTIMRAAAALLASAILTGCGVECSQVARGSAVEIFAGRPPSCQAGR